MKRYFTFLVVLSLISIGCSKKDPIGEYQPAGIAFVLQDGTPIVAGDCIDPNANYAIKIEVTTDGNTNVETTVIAYTFNGNLSSVTFNTSAPRMVNVPILEGENIVQLVDSGYSNTLVLLAPSEFEIVP